MANTFAPFGFSQSFLLSGVSANFGLKTRLIKGSNTTPIFKGDVLAEDGSNPGYLTLATPGTAVIHGIAWGFSWQTANAYNPYQPYWTGAAPSAGDVSVVIIDNPEAEFLVQAESTRTYTTADIDKNVQFAVGTGNIYNGISGAYLTGASGATTTLPFRITGIPGAPVSDNTSNANLVRVAFNNQAFKQLSGGN